ncbi:serine/threonine protein kinase [Persicimonas caeni]|uniref:non-specific serine/threonine protein kinase n=1 Tax=Persicimonas caeni TaxID=2292766 RepID=A0A4Y6PZW9_PERCE|nr:serine/threonine-protein kinase [Persicimonas caeni]QDG53813.1 serine/threonine protein kinase [Persicimonas caeni]QED35034.1 serine/threonine protein kinase [Persicimonas caeni]
MTDEQPTVEAGAVPSELAAPSDTLTGELLSGRYLVQDCLGEGAMGAVYRAEHTLMKKTVAVKVLRPQITQRQELVERFQREAQAAANIDHPNICSASDFGRMDDGTFFLVIEYLEGRTLEDELAEHGRLAPDRATHIAAQIASALARAHKLDVVHRDLKPENIMLVEREGDADFVKILDFGVAKVRLTEEHEEAQLTKAGTVWGTPRYMSPEQAAGGEVDGRSDLYSLGVILYEMLAGRPPFDDDSPARVMAMHLTEQPEPLAKVAGDADIPVHLANLVERLLSKSPPKRPPSAQALHDELLEEPPAPNLVPSTTAAASRSLDSITKAVPRAGELAYPHIERAWRWLRQQSAATQGITLALTAAVLLALFALPIVVIATGLSGPQTEEEREAVERDLTSERSDFLKSAGLVPVLEDIKEGRTTAALEALEKVDKEFAQSPHVDYLRGRVNGERGRWQASVDHYAKALDKEPLYANDAVLVEHVLERFSDRSDHRAEHARKLVEDHLDTAHVTRKLAELATYAGRSAVRDRARDVLENTGRLDDLDEWRQLGIELRHNNECKQRKEAIAAIVDEGDPAAVEVLEHFADKGRTGCGLLNLEDCYGCIRDDLKKGIEALDAQK